MSAPIDPPELTAEEERELARTIQRGLAARADLLARSESDETIERDPRIVEASAARSRLIVANLRCVTEQCKQWRNSREFYDFEASGFRGLILAADRFNPDHPS